MFVVKMTAATISNTYKIPHYWESATMEESLIYHAFSCLYCVAGW